MSDVIMILGHNFQIEVLYSNTVTSLDCAPFKSCVDLDIILPSESCKMLTGDENVFVELGICSVFLLG